MRSIGPVRSAHGSDFEPVADLCAGTIDRVRREFQHAGRFQGHLGDAKRANMLLDVDDFFVLAEKNEIDRKEHADGMNAAGRHNP